MLPRVDYAGGVSGQVDLLARGLVARGHDVTVFAVNPPAEPATYAFSRVRIPAALERATPYLFSLALARLFLDGFDVVHSHGDDHLLGVKAPLVRTFHGSSWAETQNAVKFRHRVYHMTMGFCELVSEWRASAVVVDSESTRRYLKRRADVIACGYDGRRFFPGAVKSPLPSILFVGDLDTRKRGRLLLNVFSDVVRPAVPDAELWIVSADHVAVEGVRSFGRVSGPALADLYRRAWLFCLPSSYEGFGVPYVEAMASGTPVVATHNGGADEVLGNGRYGLLSTDSDLGSALVSILQSPDRLAAMTARALERSRDYSIDRMVDQYEAIYDSSVRTRHATTFRRAVTTL